MTAPEPVVELLDEQWASIVALGEQLSDGEWALATECPGWDVRDTLSHIVGTERSLLGDPPPPLPEPTPGHVRNDVGARNEAWVQSLRGGPPAAVLVAFRAVVARRLAVLRAWGPDRFDELGPSPVGEVPYREFMRVRVMDCWVHEQDMRFTTGRPGHDDGPAPTLAFERLVSGLPYVVGKQAGAPDGAQVRFTLHGAMGRRVDVAVAGGRARVIDDGLDPTAEIDTDVQTFCRLVCGRVAGPVALGSGAARVTGDAPLGERVLGAMAFMI